MVNAITVLAAQYLEEARTLVERDLKSGTTTHFLNRAIVLKRKAAILIKAQELLEKDEFLKRQSEVY